MKSGEDATEFVVRFHVMFSVLAAFALRDCLRQTHFTANTQVDHDTSGDACANIGNTVLVLVVFWHLTIFMRGLLQYPQLLSFYRFLLPLSVWFVLPDWFLAKYAQTLEFPRNGTLWMIGGAINPCMAGMWSIPGLLILQSVYPASNDLLSMACYAKAAAIGLAVFVSAEQCLPFIWTATEKVVHRVGWGEGVAAYVIPAETLLGPMILYSYHVTKDSKTWLQPTMAAGQTMLAYTGALSIGLLVFENSLKAKL